MRSERERLDKIERMLDELQEKFRELREDMDRTMAVIKKQREEAAAAEAAGTRTTRKKSPKKSEE